MLIKYSNNCFTDEQNIYRWEIYCSWHIFKSQKEKFFYFQIRIQSHFIILLLEIIFKKYNYKSKLNPISIKGLLYKLKLKIKSSFRTKSYDFEVN